MTKKSGRPGELKKNAAALLNQQRLHEAKPLFQQLCRANKHDLESWMELGFIHGQLGEFDETVRCFRHVTQLNPTIAEAHFNLGKALRAAGKLQEAEASYLRALQIKPQWIQAYNNLGNLLQNMGRYDDAMLCYQKALAIAPGYLEAKINHSNLLQLLGRYQESMDGYRAALKIKPDHIPALRSLGRALALNSRLDEALACYETALQANPESAEFQGRKAKIYELRGDKKSAYALLEPLIKHHADEPQVALAFATVCHLGDHCDEAISAIENILRQDRGQFDPEQQPELHFAVARLYDQKGKFDLAFKHYRAANELRVRPFDIEHHTRYIDRIINTFTAGALKQSPKTTIPTRRAVFIVGMPRSGTSLVEQILASHPDVAGGGELDTVKKLLATLPSDRQTGIRYPENFAALTPDACHRAAQTYLDELAKISTKARYVTDKMPQNFLHLGLISRLFPDAHIIHCQRHPVDTCLSCYFQDFSEQQGFSFRLETLAPYYRQYQRLMAHWQQVLDMPVFNISYEALIENPQQLTRQLLEYLELEWNDACLASHKNKRLVNTASYDQVRHPIYKRSAGRWKNYKKHIPQLLDERLSHN